MAVCPLNSVIEIHFRSNVSININFLSVETLKIAYLLTVPVGEKRSGNKP